MFSKFLVIGNLVNIYLCLKPGNTRMHVTSTTFCDKEIKDIHGKPAPCGKSLAMETYGLTLPGMDEGKVTTRRDIIVAEDGIVEVEAMPDRPFQFFMFTSVDKKQKVTQLYKNKAREINALDYTGAPPGYEHSAANLKEDGWTYEGTATLDNVTVHKYTKKGPQGLDPDTKANYTAFYQTGLIPDHWTLYTDEKDEAPVKLVCMNSFTNATLREVVYSNYEARQGNITVDGAIEEMHKTYKINNSVPVLEADRFPPADSALLSAPFIDEDSREFFENNEGVDWLQRDDNLVGASAGITYFDIPKGSASDKFFHARPLRLMKETMKFQYPDNCRSARSVINKFCIYVAFDDNSTALTVKAGFKFTDSVVSENSAHLDLSVTLGKSEGSPLLDLELEAGGCALIFQYGAGKANLGIVVCISGNASAKGGPGNQTISAAVEIKVTLSVSLPVVGKIISDTIFAKFACVVAPKNAISASAEIGIARSLKIAGAGVSLDIKGNTVDHLVNRWEFFSGVNLNAWVDVLVYSDSWHWRWELWHAGPVNF